MTRTQAEEYVRHYYLDAWGFPRNNLTTLIFDAAWKRSRGNGFTVQRAINKACKECESLVRERYARSRQMRELLGSSSVDGLINFLAAELSDYEYYHG